MVNKRGQLKIQQMAFVLLAITLFFVLAGMFALIFLMAGLRNEATALEEKNALLLVTKLANSPEFSCGGAYGSDRVNCVDADKVMVLSKNIDKYSKFWGLENIEIRKIYPKGDTLVCTLSNYPDCNSIKIKSSSSGDVSGYYLENFVTLCRKAQDNGITYNNCDVAKLLVSYEQK
ncbi:hypothetical protein KAR91_45330 [Candidatus Pacearchaeota archaeon]|nr:hypothetical protein [Candidatus Pacearchaeota archaeon]